MSTVTRRDMEVTFGARSSGGTTQARAETSDLLFVRSQLQIAEWVEGALGRKITALEAFEAYGYSTLREVAEHGSASLIRGPDQPAYALRRRREELGLTIHAVAISAGVSERTVEACETPGNLSKVRDLDRIARALALDERLVGFTQNAGGDDGLGVRLRESRSAKDITTFSPKTVADLAEAAWVIRRQAEIEAKLPSNYPDNSSRDSLRSDDYSFPTWQRGYELARRVRSYIGVDAGEPIESLRHVVEDDLRIPLVQQEMHESLAGATIANGDARGVVVNQRGRNSNVWVRRMTMAHEVGHLLGDPDEYLNRLRVDDYETIERNPKGVRDVVEMRANGFAVAFLAPPIGVQRIAKAARSDRDLLGTVMNTFGISRTAAIYHIRNVVGKDVSGVSPHELPVAEDDWLGRENFMLDYFPLSQTPLSRKGRFANLVVQCVSRNRITSDTAAEWLRSTKVEFELRQDAIMQAQL